MSTSRLTNNLSAAHDRKVAMPIGSGKSRLFAAVIDQQLDALGPASIKTGGDMTERPLGAAIRAAARMQG